MDVAAIDVGIAIIEKKDDAHKQRMLYFSENSRREKDRVGRT